MENSTLTSCPEHQVYELGQTVIPGPRERGGNRDMTYLVAYDVCDVKRLRHIAKVCEDYGLRVQKSVFEAELEPESFKTFWAELGSEMEPNEDFLVAYVICKSCLQRVKTKGVGVRPEKVICYVI